MSGEYNAMDLARNAARKNGDSERRRRSSESEERPAAHAPAREKEAVAERPKLEMSKKSNALDREKTCPLLLRVFCSTSRHNPMNEYNRGKVPANELQIYTWMDATLKELTGLVREVNPEARRRGTFFDFAVVFPNRGGGSFSSRDIGTTVSGQKGPDDSKTLKDCRFVIGDYMDIAVTPPIVEDGYGYGGRRGGYDNRRGGFNGGGPRGGRGGMGDRRFRPY